MWSDLSLVNKPGAQQQASVLRNRSASAKVIGRTPGPCFIGQCAVGCYRSIESFCDGRLSMSSAPNRCATAHTLSPTRRRSKRRSRSSSSATPVAAVSTGSRFGPFAPWAGATSDPPSPPRPHTLCAVPDDAQCSAGGTEGRCAPTTPAVSRFERTDRLRCMWVACVLADYWRICPRVWPIYMKWATAFTFPEPRYHL